MSHVNYFMTKNAISSWPLWSFQNCFRQNHERIEDLFGSQIKTLAQLYAVSVPDNAQSISSKQSVSDKPSQGIIYKLRLSEQK